MASTAIDSRASFSSIRSKQREKKLEEASTAHSLKDEEARDPLPPFSPGDSTDNLKISGDSTHRQLKPRHIQLIGIGGTIGTALFVQIGQGLLNGGPGSLFIAFTFW